MGLGKGFVVQTCFFVARLLVEKYREHCESLYLLFIDLKKAYVFVPRQALWKILEKYGMPAKMLSRYNDIPTRSGVAIIQPI